MDKFKSVWFETSSSSITYYIIIFDPVRYPDHTRTKLNPEVVEHHLATVSVAEQIRKRREYNETAMLHLAYVVADLKSYTCADFRISHLGRVIWC